MLYTAPKSDPEAWRGAEVVVLSVTRTAGSAFAPSAALLADFTAGRAGWRQFERRYTDEMRECYREEPQLWIDLVEQAALGAGARAVRARWRGGVSGPARCRRCPAWGPGPAGRGAVAAAGPRTRR